MITESNPGWAARLRSRIDQELPGIMQQSMRIVEEEAKRLVYLGHPDHLDRKTGNLSRATTTETVRTGTEITASVGNDLVYAPVHEFGAAITDRYGTTRIIPPRPFLGPAFEAKKEEAAASVKRQVNEIIRSECR
ncbi:MAG TPA: hypothetical protein O0X27_05155 [Methanocorpusculum sp.]|nr:hypothetical protein [Methanocorpusculum sp.]